MVTVAINLFIYIFVFFLIGMYKPKWALFFMKKPDRFMVLVFSAVLFMIAATLYGEGMREKIVAEDPAPAVSEDSAPVVNSETKHKKEDK